MIRTGSSGGDAALLHAVLRAQFSALQIAVLGKELAAQEHSAASPRCALLCLVWIARWPFSPCSKERSERTALDAGLSRHPPLWAGSL